jgi:hypothetical protein
MKGRYHILAGSFAVAALFWFSVTMGGMFRAHVEVPLDVSVPSDVALLTPLPKHIEVLVEANGWQLLFLNAGQQARYELNGSRLRSGRILINRELIENMKLPPGVRAISAYPETLVVKLDRFITKDVPLRFTPSELTFAQGVGMVRPIELTPDSVQLSGAESVLRDVQSWPLESRAYTDLAMPVVEEVNVIDSLPGIIHVSPEKVEVMIPAEQIADVSFHDIPIQLIGVPPGREVLLERQQVSVAVRGGMHDLTTVEPNDFRVEVHFSELLADTSGWVAPTVIYPNRVQLLSVEPSRIRYTVRE